MKTPIERCRRSYLRLSVRSLLFLVLAIGGGLGWQVHLARVQREAVAQIVRGRGRVWYDWEVKYVPNRVNPYLYLSVPKAKPWWPKWLVDQLGPDYFGNVALVEVGADNRDAVMAAVSQLHHLRRLHLHHSKTDTRLSHLRGLSQLEVLVVYTHGVSTTELAVLKYLKRLRYLNFTTASSFGTQELCYLKEMTALEGLSLNGSSVDDLSPIRHLTGLKTLSVRFAPLTDAGLAGLKDLGELATLDLSKTLITDVGLEHLRGLKKLRTLRLESTRVSQEAEVELQRAIPSITIPPRRLRRNPVPVRQHPVGLQK